VWQQCRVRPSQIGCARACVYLASQEGNANVVTHDTCGMSPVQGWLTAAWQHLGGDLRQMKHRGVLEHTKDKGGGQGLCCRVSM